MKDLGITKGEWRRHTRYPKVIIAIDEIGGSLTVGSKEDNDLLIDAGNTAQKCGLLPSELLKQRDDLRRILFRICKDAEITALGEVSNFVKVSVDSINNGIKVINDIK